MKRLAKLAVGAIVLGGAAFWALTRPATVDAAAYAGLTGDPDRGRLVFLQAGCGSCHTAPGAEASDTPILAGGQRFDSPFGTFVAPNISTDPVQGIGGWSVLDLANAVTRGVSPDGAHYYPAFPWDSYRGMAAQDLADLHSYLATLPADATPDRPHELPLPVQLRRGIGLWKTVFARDGWVVDAPGLTPAEQRGRYLTEVMGHCGECHTPRDVTGTLDYSRWLGGAPNPSGRGGVPNITPGKLSWSEAEIAEYLSSGFTPDYDSAGGHMALVVGNYGKLPAKDREAVAAYLKRVPAVQ